MEWKHTPGAWEWTGESDLVGGTPPDSVIFCTVEFDDNYYAVIHCEPADRRLIAAAPDLLAACRAVLDFSVDKPWTGLADADGDGIRNLLQFVIAEAEGR